MLGRYKVRTSNDIFQKFDGQVSQLMVELKILSVFRNPMPEYIQDSHSRCGRHNRFFPFVSIATGATTVVFIGLASWYLVGWIARSGSRDRERCGCRRRAAPNKPSRLREKNVYLYFRLNGLIIQREKILDSLFCLCSHLDLYITVSRPQYYECFLYL